MDIYLIRNAATDTRVVKDPYNHPLSEQGQARARELALLCRKWGIELLVTNMMLNSMQTADAISAELPNVERWDVTDLEELVLDDLMGDPTASHLVSTWTPQQVETGLARLWIRTMAVLTRILLYAEARGLGSVAIVAGERVLQLLLLNWSEQDWTHFASAPVIAPGSVSRVSIEGDSARIDWVNAL